MDRKTLFLSLASGILLFLSFPKFEFHFLVWFSLTPLLIAIGDKTPQEAFLSGLITGLVYNIGIIYWVTFVVVQYGYLPLYLGISAMLLLALYLSVYVALFAAGVVFFARRNIAVIISAPVLWICLEYGKSHFLTGFPWENLAYALYDNLHLIQIVDITGTYGLSFLIVIISCVFYEIVTSSGVERKKTVSLLMGSIIIIGMVFAYGLYRVDTVKDMESHGNVTDVVIAQGNIDQSLKWSPEYQYKTLNIYRDLSLKMAQANTDLIVWPETAAPFFFQNIDDKHRLLLRIARERQSYLLFGSPSFLNEKGRRVFQNSAYLISPSGEIVGKYDKMHLVPYGEYVPFRKFFFFLEKLVVGVGDFVPGSELKPLALDGGKTGILICYEGIFPQISRSYRKKGASLLINITNDAWFGTSSAPYQHLVMTAFRAVENRVYIIRAANTGISAIIAPTGQIVSRSGLFERTGLRGSVKFINGSTFYSQYGDIFAYICFIILIITFFISIQRRKRND